MPPADNILKHHTVTVLPVDIHTLPNLCFHHGGDGNELILPRVLHGVVGIIQRPRSTHRNQPSGHLVVFLDDRFQDGLDQNVHHHLAFPLGTRIVSVVDVVNVQHSRRVLPDKP